MVGTHNGAGERCEEFSPEEKAVTEMCDELTPIAHLPVPEGEEVVNQE